MFKHILVPLDGSRLAEVALPVATVLAAATGAEMTLLHVLERGAPQQVHGEPHLSNVDAAQRYLAGLAERYAQNGVHIGFHVHATEEGNVAASIVGHADELGADLIALTTHGGGDLKRILLGSIAQQVLQRGNAPVLLVPSMQAQTERYSLQSIMVPLYGHAANASVLPVAQALCAAISVKTMLLRVVPTLSTLRGERASTMVLTPIAATNALDLEAQEARDYLIKVAQSWPCQPAPEYEVLRGEPIEMIVEQIEKERPDLLIMATHGRAGLPGLWAGSATPRIASRSTRPMLLIRVAETEGETSDG